MICFNQVVLALLNHKHRKDKSLLKVGKISSQKEKKKSTLIKSITRFGHIIF
jgi:hypothetical protein